MKIVRNIRRILQFSLNPHRESETPLRSLPYETQQLIQTVQPYTMIDALRLVSLHRLALEISNNKIKGHFVECGVCNGGSAALLASAICSDSERQLWQYDTLEDLHHPTPIVAKLAQEYTRQCRGSIDMVIEVISKVGFPLERVVFRKGFFKDTFKEPLPESVALLHIDADWYESVLDSLKTFYPLVVEGGTVVLDDFGHWEGTREAFYDFCKEYNIKPLLERVGYTQAFWRKGQKHNRDSPDRYKLWM